MTKQELIEYIKSLDCESFFISRELEAPSCSNLLPDARVGIIYPPNPHRISYYRSSEKLTMKITGFLNNKIDY